MEKRQIDIWLVVPTKAVAPNWSSIRAGPDVYDHTLIIQDEQGVILALPCLNTDPGIGKSDPPLGHGVYGLYAGVHRYGTPKAIKAFNVLWLTRELVTERWPFSLIHGSSLRRGLPSKSPGQKCDHINFHSGGIGALAWDWSEGCFTAPGDWFTPLRASYPDGSLSVMSYAPTVDRAIAQAKEELEPLRDTYVCRSTLRG